MYGDIEDTRPRLGLATQSQRVFVILGKRLLLMMMLHHPHFRISFQYLSATWHLPACSKIFNIFQHLPGHFRTIFHQLPVSSSNSVSSSMFQNFQHLLASSRIFQYFSASSSTFQYSVFQHPLTSSSIFQDLQHFLTESILSLSWYDKNKNL